MGTEEDLTSLRSDVDFLGNVVSELLKIVQDGQIEMQALEGALIEHHGLSLDVLQEYRAQATKRRDAIGAAFESAKQKLERFQGPPQ